MTMNIPEMNKKAVGWIIKQIRKDLWKVSKWYDYEDLLQDGLLTILECYKRYPHYDEPHMINIIKLVYHQHIVHLIRRKLTGVQTPATKDKIELRSKCPEISLESIQESPLNDSEEFSISNDFRTIERYLLQDSEQELKICLRRIPDALYSAIEPLLDPDSDKRASANLQNEFREYLFNG
jgi:DNA-directed RNA polymerase specialized sigma24 family protein